MPDQELSETSDEEAPPVILTRAQKAAKTRARHVAEEQAASAQTEVEISRAGGRRVAMQKALKKKIWHPNAVKDTSPGTENTPSTTVATASSRKRAASAAADQPGKKKKSKARDETDIESGMDVDEFPVTAKAKKTANTKIADGARSAGKKKEKATTRRYVPTPIDSDEELRPQKPVKLVDKPHVLPAGTAKPTVNPKPKAKKASSATDTEEEIDNLLSQSEEDDQSDPASQSDPDDGEFPADLTDEHAQIIQSGKVSTGADDLLDSSDDTTPSGFHRRQASSSSRGSIPPDTDYDDIPEGEDEDEEKEKDDDAAPELVESEEEEIVTPAPAPRPKKTTAAQQSKYAQENPEIRNSKVVHGGKVEKIAAVPETSWSPTARVTFPPTGGQIKLLVQNDTLKAVLKGAIDLALHEIAFKEGYTDIVSRGAYARRLLRLAAKAYGPRGEDIEKRAKKDTTFCTLLAPLICTRGGNLRNTLRVIATSKVATHYGFNAPGITPSQIRSIVKQLKENQQFILPYASAPVLLRAESQSDGALAADTAVISNTPKVVLTFINNLPFHAPAVIDILHEGWWSSPKSFGFQHVTELKSNRPDRPMEVVLPDAMLCLGTVNAWAAATAWESGHYVYQKEFSQARLENTYKSLLEVLQKQRNGHSAKTFNRTMHELYIKVSRSQAGVASAASGSANDVISLAIDSD
ncbi:hypothetical protein DFH08DRAFT_1013982 [Mycena albidolilacea]|uniref:DUF6532 domain-containing protein n=1 Tax=Mycena albidolilacea TaxID=1033008 RepID=A0AAD7ENA2_9AGAR|nr:hypothetical protein DFH08DRAFT_1013982 [Mycena albidolilacea]